MAINFSILQPKDFTAADALWSFTKGVVLRDDDNPENFIRFLERNPGCSFGAWHDKELMVGAILAGHDGRRGYLYHLAVRPDFRRQGIGKALTEHALSALQSHGIKKFHAYVKGHHVSAANFWKHLSWNARSDIAVYSLLSE